MAKTETIKIEDLTQDPKNARRRDKRAKGAIKASLERFGDAVCSQIDKARRAKA